MKGGNQVGAIVYGKLWLIIQGSAYVLIVSYLPLPLDGVGRDAIFNKGGGGIILGAQWVGSTQDNISPAFL